MNLTFTKNSEQIRVTRSYKVEGAAPQAQRYRSTQFRPAVLVIVLTDGSISSATLSGPRVKKDGTDAAVWADERLYSRSDWPTWIRTFIEGMGL